MARRKTPSERVKVNASLSQRLREIRQELFGDHGGPELARRLGLPARTWYNYETGVTVPAEVLLNFIDQTGASSRYLFTGEGPRYTRADAGQSVEDLSAVELLRCALARLESPSGDLPAGSSGGLPPDCIPVRVYPRERIGDGKLDGAASVGQIIALRRWIANPSQTIAVQVDDDAMYPILPAGSMVAFDRSSTDPAQLHGRIVAACPDGTPMIRWLEVSGRHMILRANSIRREHPIIPLEVRSNGPSPILGAVVCSWSHFSDT